MIAVGVGTAVGLNALLSRKIGEHKPMEACRAATTGLILTVITSLIFSAVLNIILDPIMIFGLFGFPALGIRGAAIATVIGQIAGSLAALLFNRIKNPVIHVHLKNYHFEWQDVKDIYRVGFPTIIMQAIGSVMTFAVNSILLNVSTTAVTFFGIHYKLQNFLMMPINGLGQAAIRQFVLLVPCLWLFIKTIGFAHCWYAFWIAEIAAFLFSCFASHKLMNYSDL